MANEYMLIVNQFKVRCQICHQDQAYAHRISVCSEATVMADNVFGALEHLPDIGMPKIALLNNGHPMQTFQANNGRNIEQASLAGSDKRK